MELQDLLVECGAVVSLGSARRIIRSGGAAVDGVRILDPEADVDPGAGIVVGGVPYVAVDLVEGAEPA